MGRPWGFALSRKLRDETRKAQDGTRKPRGFWKKFTGPAWPILVAYSKGKLTLKQASAKLGVSSTYRDALPPVQWYCVRYGLIKRTSVEAHLELPRFRGGMTARQF
jgi:hypothetical protein